MGMNITVLAYIRVLHKQTAARASAHAKFHKHFVNAAASFGYCNHFMILVHYTILMWCLLPAILQHLIILTTYIVQVNVTVLFHTKTKPFITKGTRYIWNRIMLSRYLKLNLREIIDAVVHQHSFSYYPKKLLQTMLSDNRKYIRSSPTRKLLCAQMEKKEEQK